MKQICTLLIIMFFTASLATTALASEEIMIAGAGPSTKVVQLFVDQFSKQKAADGYSFVVPPNSIKHAGGLNSTAKNLFGRTGRPLNQSEIATGKEEIFLAKVPIAFAVGNDGPISSLTLHQLEQIFTGKLTNWKELGGPDLKIVTVGREPTEALFSELKADYPFFKHAEFDVVLKKDNDVVNFLLSPAGKLAIAFGAAPNFTKVKPVSISGDFSAGVRLGLVYDKSKSSHPLVPAVKAYAQSDAWKKAVQHSGMISVN